MTYALDPILGDAGAEELLVVQNRDEAAIAANIDGLRRVREEVPGFFDAFDYDWAFLPEAYDYVMEANLQTRALQHLAMLWQSPHRPDGLRFDHVVVRYTSETGTDPCTPLHLAHQGLQFVVSTFSFQEFALLFTRALIDGLAGSGQGWRSLQTFKAFPSAVSPFLKQAILRVLTNDTFHPGVPGESPIDAAKRQSDWFSGASETGNIDEGMEVPLTYALIDFALAHELGHALLRHDGAAREPDLRLVREQDADALGFALYNTSWGWRDELMDPAPLNQGPRILLGPLLFHLHIRWHLALRQGILYAAMTRKRPTPKPSAARDLKEIVAESEQRGSASMRQLGAYEAHIRSRGAVFTDEDAAVYSALAAAGGAFALHVFNSVSQIPEADYQVAVSLGTARF